jgi:hypothetical protein
MASGIRSREVRIGANRIGGAVGTRFWAALAAFVLVNVLVGTRLGPAGIPLDENTMSETNYASPLYGSWTWWMVRAFVHCKPPADIVLLGSSQINSPSWGADARITGNKVDCLLHREVIALEKSLQKRSVGKGDVKVLNCAVQGGMASDYYMIERTLLAGKHAPPVVIIGLSPRDFIDNKLPSASSTELFRFCSRFAGPGKLAALAYPDAGARYLADLSAVVNKLPLRRLSDIVAAQVRDQVQAKQPQSNDPQSLAAAIYNSNQQVKVGQWVVETDTKGIFVDNSKEYIARYANAKPKSYTTQLAFFRAALHDLKEKGCRVMIVEMPTLKCNRDILPESFWQDYRKTIIGMCRELDVAWCDLSESNEFVKQDFVDTVHLNDRGGVKFFDKLAGVIAGESSLSAALVNRVDVAQRRDNRSL